MALPHAPDSEEVLRAACSGNIKLFKSQNPVLHAARQGHTATVEYLIEKGADPATLSTKGTELHNAVGKGSELLYLGSSAFSDKMFDKKSQHVMPYCYIVIYGGHIDCVKLLLSKGVDVDLQSYGRTALMWACSLGREDAVRVLLEHQANVHPKTNNLLPLASAVAANSLPCVELLVKDDIGALDGTHVKARLPHGQEILYIDSKGYPTQNIFVVDFDMCFTSALAGWEGSAHGSYIFRETLHRQELNFPHPLKNKYYLVDSRYSHIKGYMAPYRGYNMRNIVERTLNVWKSRWPILRDMPYYNIDTQRDIVIATMATHNYIRKKCNVDNAFQMAENERYIPSVDFDVGTTSMANNIDGKNSGAKVYVKPSEATPWRDDEATLLFNAADNGNAEIIKCLLQAGGDPNIIDEHGNKPIQVAAIRCNRAAVKVLLPVTQRILSVPEWSVDGVIEFMQYEYRRRQLDGLVEYMDSYYYSTRLESTEAGRKAKKPRATIIPKKDFPEVTNEARKKTADEKATGEEEFKKKTEDEKATGEEEFKKKAADEKATGEEEFKKKATDVKARREEECKKNTADAKARREEECKKKAADAKARGEEAFKKARGGHMALPTLKPSLLLQPLQN
ncbi:hypothetical protein CQW23_19924 [Capsicum baccatum]|uniref:DDE Tnp4 domain-containing protein n=1 Tax=Capsicum baccatum TaxID=33114 RepID=A0A2G2W766_CAPBA|nr:hypothetical protein CQW23_19924 [Capsicum baccatum]